MSNQINISILGLYKYNNALFDNMLLPDDVDKETLINEIIIKCSNMSLVYPDYDFMKLAIENWSRAELSVWTRLNKAFNEEYNPIWNVDGVTKENRNINANSSNTGTDSVKGFNSNEWADHDRTIGSGNSNTLETYEQVRQGNIGVTKSQELLEAELQVRPKLNIYDYIANSFKRKFTIMIY